MNCIFIKNGKQIKQKALRIQRKTIELENSSQLFEFRFSY